MGLGGFTIKDLARCQVIARLIGLIYNWWSLFVRLANPEKHSEAITSRPMLLGGVARQTQHGGQKKRTVSIIHGQSTTIKERVAFAFALLSALIRDAEQLSQPERWRRILSRVFVQKGGQPTLSTLGRVTISGGVGGEGT